MSIELIGVMITVVVTISLYFLERYHRKQDRKKLKDKLEEEVKFSSLMDNKIEDLRYEFNADRVWICQFHNGGHFYPTGKSIQKFSMFYETVSVDTQSIKMQFQNIPINLFAKSTNQLFEHNMITISDFEDSNINTYGLKDIAEANGCKSTYLFAVKNFEGRFLGIMGLDYTKEKIKLTQEDLIELNSKSSSLGEFLMRHMQVKTT